MSITVRAMTDEDASRVLAIYQQGIDEGNATFETTAPDWPVFRSARLATFSQVAVDPDGTVLGWVAASRVSSRACYSGVIEHSVYVDPAGRGRGVGRQLLERLLEIAGSEGIWTIQSSIFPENQASIALHESVGFRVVGNRHKIAQHQGRWRDTVLIERRSPTE